VAETLAQLAARVDALEAVVLKLIEGARRNDIQTAVAPLQARKDQRDGEGGYEIASLIG